MTTQLFNAYCYSINKIENKSIDIKIFVIKPIIKINFSISPNMPTGEIFNDKINSNEYYLFDFCLDFPCFNKSKSSYNKYIYDKIYKNNITIISSFSKVGIPGVHFGYILTSNKDIVKYVNEYIDFYTCVSTGIINNNTKYL